MCARELTALELSGICRDCWEGLEGWSGASCARCGLPFPSETPGDSALGLCGRCRAEPYDFDLARCYGTYSGGLRAAVLLLKFQRRERLGWRLGGFLEAPWQSLREGMGSERPILVPVPLHASRERERGFNQAAVLAEGLRRALARASAGAAPPIDQRCLRRIRATPSQAGLSIVGRKDNVRGAFQVLSPESLHGRAVVFVDDVMTTGATLSACADVLRRAGAARVMALTVARAAPPFAASSPAG